MFVPRALRLKGTRESEKAHAKALGSKSRSTGNSNAKELPQTSNGRQDEVNRAGTGPQYTIPAITSEHLGHLVCGIELLLTDYAYQDKEGAQWLQRHTREIEGQKGYVHLSALLEHSNISSLKPAATQISLQRALREQASTHLELSEDGYFVRRRPSTYPLHFVPSNSFDVVNDEGLSFWDQRTIYVEPHTRDLCKTPAKVAYWIKEHSQMRDKWLPVQAVHTLYNSCAFVVLSGNVTHQGTWQKWRALGKPEFWKIITKTEHTKRSEEYVNLLKEEKAMSKQAKSHSTSPQTNSPAELAETTTTTTPAESNELVGDKRPAQEDAEQATRKRKRGKKKKKEGRAVTEEAFEAETPVNGLSGEQDLDDDVANRSRSADRGNEATIPHDAKTARLEQKNTQEREKTSSIG